MATHIFFQCRWRWSAEQIHWHGFHFQHYMLLRVVEFHQLIEHNFSKEICSWSRHCLWSGGQHEIGLVDWSRQDISAEWISTQALKQQNKKLASVQHHSFDCTLIWRGFASEHNTCWSDSLCNSIAEQSNHHGTPPPYAKLWTVHHKASSLKHAASKSPINHSVIPLTSNICQQANSNESSTSWWLCRQLGWPHIYQRRITSKHSLLCIISWANISHITHRAHNPRNENPTFYQWIHPARVTMESAQETPIIASKHLF